MDSLELVRVRNRLSSALAMELPATLLLDFPSVKDKCKTNSINNTRTAKTTCPGLGSTQTTPTPTPKMY